MTKEQWKSRMELLEASCIVGTMCKATNTETGKWVFVGFGTQDDVAVMTGDDLQTSPKVTLGGKLLYRWGTRNELADLLEFRGNIVRIEYFADAILDRVLAGTWDNSKDSPSLADAELIVTE